VMDKEEGFERVIETLKKPVAIDPGFNSRVMSRIEAEPARAVHAHSWLARRWTVRVSPLGGLAAAAAIAAVVIAMSLVMRQRDDAAPLVAAATPETNPEATQFVLIAPGAKSVTLVGDFNDWDASATRLIRQAGDGVWFITMQLPPGRYNYAFVVDGTSWRTDPNAPGAEDDFGRRNSVVTIGGA
jgi:hypothetical protein